MAKKKPNEVVTEKLSQAEPIALGEIGESQPIEVMSDSERISNEYAERRAFMNQILTIVVHPSNEPGSYTVITPSVNGVSQPIIRGIESKVKRKYVEVLARTRTTGYTPFTPNPNKPENIQMTPTEVVTYPFAVIHDPHPKGRAWLDAIQRQR